MIPSAADGLVSCCQGSVLDGIQVLEIGGYVTAPYATMVLADLGADVVKLEAPDHGDPFRGWGSAQYSPTFVALNRNKRSAEVDLGSRAGQKAVHRLTRSADVAVVNVRPTARDRLGISSRQLRRENAGLIYCSITGFGEDGPYAGRPGYDTIGQAMSGLLGMLIDPADGKPPGVSVADHLTGLTAAQAILAALFHRERTGTGQDVRTSLLEASLSFIGENTSRYLADGDVPSRGHRTSLAQIYALQCADGRPLVIHLSSPNKFWDGLTAALGLEELGRDKALQVRQGRVANYERIRAHLQERAAGLDRDDCLRLLHEQEIPAAPVYGLDEVLDDPQVRHLDMVWDFRTGEGDEKVSAIRPGYRLASADPLPRRRPPRLGEHTIEVLGEEDRAGVPTGSIEEGSHVLGAADDRAVPQGSRVGFIHMADEHGARMRYRVSGTGPPVVLCAGTGYPLDTWPVAFIDRLAECFMVIEFDYRGTGQSTGTNGTYSTRGFAADVCALIDALGIDRCHLLGHSMGGRVAQWLAIDFPYRVDRLALVATGAGESRLGEVRERGVPLHTAAEMAELGFREYLRRNIRRLFFTPEYLATNPPVAEALLDAFWSERPAVVDYLKHVSARQEHSTVDRLGDIAAHTLVLVGESDTFQGSTGSHLGQSQSLATAVMNAELHIMRNVAHGLFWQEPIATADLITGWLLRAAEDDDDS